MPFSRLFALLLMLGAVPVLLAGFAGWAFYVFMGYNALLFILLAVDLIITPGAKHLEVLRICDEKLSMGTENEIIIRIRNNSKHTLELELKDEIPPYFEIKSHIIKVKAVPHFDSEGSCRLVPRKRGEFHFGEVHARYNGVLKLCSKKGRFKIGKSYKVYPNLKDLRKYSFAALNKSQLAYGNKKAKMYGIGTEFESLKEYNEGDDYRKVNWLATAKSNKLMVNSYQPEKNQQVFILLDSSRVMNSEINFIKKLDYAINSAFLLAEIAIKKDDNIGLLVFDSEVKRYVKPGKGMGHFQLIAENLYNVEENFVTADYSGALLYLNNQHKRRSLLCIFTELFNAGEAIQLVAALKSLARTHIPLIITIMDTRIYETASQEVDDSTGVYLKSAALKLVEEREKIKRIFQQAGIGCIDVPPDKLSFEVVNEYLSMKAMGRI